MKNEERNNKIKYISKQMEFCQKCMQTLIDDFTTDNKAQDADPWDNYNSIRNHTRHANGVIYIRRQLMKLEKILRDG